MLARTTDARATRDIDLLSTGNNLEEAVDDLKHLAALNLEDFVTFSFAGMSPIKAEDEYRSGMNVRFHVRLGNKSLQDISIDLVIDAIPPRGFRHRYSSRPNCCARPSNMLLPRMYRGELSRR